MFGQRVPDSEAFRQGVGQAIIDRIRSRTDDNIDRKSKRFKSYSKAYASTLEFKAAGKSVGNPNLRLTGDMLGLMDVVSTGRSTITIGWDEGDENKKAHGHITGSDPGPKVRRDFFGLPEKDYDQIATGFRIADDGVPEDAGVLSSLLTLRELFS